jgi:flagellar biosynthesis regulator FlaF
VQYARKVLLTFASDGLHTAQQVAAEFRKKRENLHHIGVVILNEHSDLVNNNPEQFISACFHQVKLAF